MRRGIGRLRAGGSGFTPVAVFPSGAAGAWIDPSDISTGFQAFTGGAQTASGQPTGIRLDKRKGLALASESLTNGNFASGGTGWTVGGGWSTPVGGPATHTPGSTNDLSQTYAVSGIDRVVITVVGMTAGTLNVSEGTVPFGTISANGTYTYTAQGNGPILKLSPSLTFDGGVSFASVKNIPGNHVVQATAGNRPEYDVISGISSDFLDGTSDGYSTATFAAASLTNDMDLFVALNRLTTGNMIAFSEAVASATKFFGAMQAGVGTSGSAAAGVGSAWTCWVNGVQVGGTATTTADALNTALGSGAYKVLEFRDLDLSAWTQFTFGLYTSNMYGGDQAQIILCPAQSTATRNKLRTYVGAKCGLVL